MTDWNSNNLACLATWTTLKILDQITRRKTFKSTGAVTVKQLTFYGSASSAAIRKVQASTIATQMDNVFRMMRKAKYEKGITNSKAVSATVDVLSQASKTVADLAAVIDENYSFKGEGHDG